MTKEVKITLSNEMHTALKEAKGHLTWKECLIDGVLSSDEKKPKKKS